MKIDQKHYQEMTVIVPHDSLVGDDASQLGEALSLALSENPHDVAVDVSRVSQIDSKGLEVLVDTTEQLIRSGRALKLISADETLREILELTELASLFEYSDSPELTPEGI
ncbi:MAG: STAS domain-containing protein [bacterium]|nr:STAS domain-containing protein [bacterium]